VSSCESLACKFDNKKLQPNCNEVTLNVINAQSFQILNFASSSFGSIASVNIGSTMKLIARLAGIYPRFALVKFDTSLPLRFS